MFRRIAILTLAVALLAPASAACVPYTLAGLLGFGGGFDFAQDYLGARALLHGGALYPVLGEAMPALGIVDLRPEHRSTHPPFAFLLAVPVAWLPYPVALSVWMWAMLACELLALRLFGWRWRALLLSVPLLLLWPPALSSLGQLTPIWLLGLAIAWRHRSRPEVAGVALALASLPKYFAAVTLGVFLRPRRWAPLAAFAGTALAVLCLVLALRPDALGAYAAANVVDAPRQAARPDNGALLAFCWRYARVPGVVAASIAALSVLWRALNTPDEPRAWACWTWLSVALLPIAWVYSLLPLLPWLVRRALTSSGAARFWAIAALAAPLLSPVPGGGRLPIGVVLCVVCAAGAFALGDRSHSPYSGTVTKTVSA